MAYDIVKDWTQIFASNNTGTATIFTPTNTAPVVADAGVIDLTELTGHAPLAVMAQFWIAGSDGHVPDVACVGIQKQADGLYAGMGLMKADGTAGTAVGTASHAPSNTELWLDTLVAMTGTNDQNALVYYSPADNSIAHVIFPVWAFTLIKFLVAKQDATSVNGRYRILREVQR